MRTPRLSSLLLSLLAVAAPLGAQQGVGQQQGPAPQRGWIGVSFEILTTGDQQGLHTQATITDVVNGSPAQKAGLQPGDRLVSVNGMGYQNDFGRVSETLHPGDSVRIVVERNGRLREVRLEAAALPPDIVPPTPTVTWGVSRDSVVDLMFRAMDSLRDQLRDVVNGSVSMVRIPDIADSIFAISRGQSGQLVVSTTDGDSAATWPMLTITRVEGGNPISVFFPQGSPPFSLGASPSSTAHDSLLGAMRAAAMRVLPPPTTSRVPLDQAQEQASIVADYFQPLMPYRLGQNWVAGAEMVDVRPGLSTYFRVSRGVLVVKVPGGTPAAMAGLRPGDVIVAVGRTPVRSIADLRTGLSEPGDTLKLQVIRKGRKVEALLGR